MAGLPDVYSIRAQSKIDITADLGDVEPGAVPFVAPTKPSIAAILDSVPVANHPAIGEHIILVDPDDLETAAVGLRTHGTAMASLVIRGDLRRQETALDRSLVVRPLMYAPWANEAYERFAPEELLVDSFIRAVQDLREDPAAAAPDVFLINLSLGDSNRPYFGRASAWARALDWLAHHYGILFVVSAGNAPGDIELATIADDEAF